MIRRLSNNLRIVVIDNPYDSLDNPMVQDLFAKTMALKIQGYRSVYPYGMLPTDTYDFVATHQLVCQEKNGSYEVLMGYKSITLQRCQIHRLAFQPLAVLQASQATPHDQVMESILAKHAKNPEKISAGCGWTIHPSARENEILRKTLKDLMTTMLVYHEQETGTLERVCGAIPRVKTDNYFENLGYQRLSHNGEVLPPFSAPSHFGEQAVMLHCPRFTEAAFTTAEHYRDIWDARVVVETQENVEMQKEAA
jgi:hypothetical protein